MSLTRVLRIPRRALCVAIAALLGLIAFTFSPYAPWHGSQAVVPAVRVLGAGLLFSEHPDNVTPYVWKKTDFGPWLQETYSFNVSGGSVLAKASRLLDQVDQQDSGFRMFVQAPKGVIMGSDIVGTMTLSRALDLLTQGTPCQWEIVDQSVLTVFCDERPKLRPQTQARFLAELGGAAPGITCSPRYWADPNAGANADFNIPAGDAAVTVAQWFSIVAHTTCKDQTLKFPLSHDMLSGHPTRLVQGRYTAGRAIEIMLEGSGLSMVDEEDRWRLTTDKKPDWRKGS